MIRRLSLALCAFVTVLVVVPAASAATVPAKLRVLTPDKVLDPGTTYYVPSDITVPTTPDADCFGPPGGSGAEFTYDKPNALSLLASAARADDSVAPLALTDQFGFGLGICGIGGQEAKSGDSFWYFKVNHEEASLGADQVELKKGDDVLFYLAPDDFPNPNPAELELKAPAGVKAGAPFSVSVVEHKCVTDQTTFDTTCDSGPASGVAVSGGDKDATTGTDGTATVSVADVGVAQLAASRGTDIPSEVLDTCVGPESNSCPNVRGQRIVGSPEDDKIKGTAGLDEIRSRGGDDTVDVRKGGADTVNCGAGRDTVLLKRATASDGLVIKGNCEKVKG
jgi:Domain of unknown function (DUF4430)/RTX calcium-binding nonapeptide repeat (4 copies)